MRRSLTIVVLLATAAAVWGNRPTIWGAALLRLFASGIALGLITIAVHRVLRSRMHSSGGVSRWLADHRLVLVLLPGATLILFSFLGRVAIESALRSRCEHLASAIAQGKEPEAGWYHVLPSSMIGSLDDLIEVRRSAGPSGVSASCASLTTLLGGRSSFNIVTKAWEVRPL